MKKSNDGSLMPMYQALDLTQKMYEHAESGTWVALHDLEANRDQLIKQFFDDYQGARTPDLESIVSEMQTINQNILRMVLSARDGLRMEMSQVKKAGKAARAYIQHAS